VSAKNSLTRRRLLRQLLLGASLAPVALAALRTARADGAPLVAVDSPEAKALAYVEDAKLAKEAKPGNHCGDCALYQGPGGSAQGPCQAFPGKAVKSAGWCRSWAPQM
jgi:High potential iron-sulfur protein